MKIYTKKGDSGRTSLFSGGRVSKSDPRVEAYGTVDELVSHVGLLRAELPQGGPDERLLSVQETLFAVGGVLADPEGRAALEPGSRAVDELEAWIDEMESALDPLTSFILPAGCRSAAAAHVARAVCRRSSVAVRRTTSPIRCRRRSRSPPS